MLWEIASGPGMYPSINQDLGDGIPEAVAIEDADQAINRDRGIALACQIVRQGDHSEVVTLFDLLGGTQLGHVNVLPS